MGGGLQDLVFQKFRIIRVVFQELFHDGVCLGRVVPPQGGGDPLLWEEDVAGPLDILQGVQGRTDVAEGFFLTERMVEEAERGLHPGLVAPVLRK